VFFKQPQSPVVRCRVVNSTHVKPLAWPHLFTKKGMLTLPPFIHGKIVWVLCICVLGVSVWPLFLRHSYFFCYLL
jgi:hypothetical protein